MFPLALHFTLKGYDGIFYTIAQREAVVSNNVQHHPVITAVHHL